MKLLVMFNQLWAYWLFRAISYLWRQPKVNRQRLWLFPERISYIFVSNHRSHLDGLMVATRLPFRKFLRLFPFAFMAKNNWLDTWWKKALFYPFGMFPAYRTARKQNSVGLDRSLELLDDGFTLYIFPEGSIALPRERRPRKGVSILAHTQKLCVVPVQVDWKYAEDGQKKGKIIFGSQYCLWGEYDYGKFSHFIMEHIYQLKY